MALSDAYGNFETPDYGLGSGSSNLGLKGDNFASDIGSSLDQFGDYSSYNPDYSSYNPDVGFGSFSTPDYSFNSTGSYGLGSNSLSGQTSPTANDDFLSKITNMFGMLPGVGRGVGIANSASRLGQNPSAKTGTNLLGQTMGGAPGGILSMFSSDNPGKGWGSAVTSTALGAINPALGVLSGMFGLGSNMLNGVNPNGEKAAPGTLTGNQGEGFNLEGILKGLGGLYAANQASKATSEAGQGSAAVQQQINQLSNMYGQDSPYAQALRQNLERKDAAAGRRSQYGPREAQLQAALADKAAGVASTIGNLATSGQTNALAMKAMKDKERAQQLSMLFGLGKQSGVFDKLGSMFNTSNPAPALDSSSWNMAPSNYDVNPGTGSYGLSDSGGGLGLRPSSGSFWDF